jgi:signal peptidase II
MKTNRLFRNIVIVSILALNIGCDQISKSIVRNSIGLDQKFHFLDNHLMFTRVENSGAFLSLGDDLSDQIKFVLLVFIPIVALIFAMYYLFSRTSLSRSTILAISFIVGGGIGNIYDRYLYGSVTDFMHIDLVLFKTGIFNMADVSIMIGAFILIFSSILRHQKTRLTIDSDGLDG